MSIKPKLLLTFLAFAVFPVLSLGVFGFQAGREALDEKTIRSLEVETDFKAQRIAAFLEEKKKAVAVLNNTEEVRKSLPVLAEHSDDFGHGEFVAAGEALDGVLGPLEALFGLDDIVLATPDGGIVYQSNKTHAESWLGKSLPAMGGKASCEKRKTGFFVHGHDDGGYGIILTDRIRGADGSLLGYVALDLGLESIYEVVQDQSGMGRSSITVLGKHVPGKGYQHLTSPMRGKVHDPQKVVPFVNSDTPMEQAVRGGAGSGIHESCGGQGVLAVWRHIPNLDMGLVSKVSTGEAFSSVTQLKNLTILFSIMSSLFAGGIALLVFRSISSPLEQLKKRAAEIGSGDLEEKESLRRKDEFGTLSRAIETMAINLKKVTASRDELNREMAERQRAEELLRESEKRYRDIFDGASDLIQSVGAGGSLLFVNNAWLNTLGYEESELENLTILDIIHPDDRAHCMKTFQKITGGETIDSVETAFLTKSGQKIDVEGSVSFHFEGDQFVASRGIFRDVTEQKAAEKALKREKKFLKEVMDGVADPFMVIATDHRVLLMNRVAQKLLPESMRKNAELRCHEASHNSSTPCLGSDHPCPLEEVKRTGKVATVVHQHTMGDGEIRTFELQASPLLREDGTLEGIIESSRDITARVEFERMLEEKRKALHYLAHHDELTKLPNRLLFNDRLQHAMAKARRNEHQLALMLLDLDRFKNINDSLGHQIGDQVLREVSRRLKKLVREADTVARLGGDEFLVLIEHVTDPQALVTLAEKIKSALGRPIAIEGQELSPGASIGISLFPSDAVDGEGLMKCADIAMYRVKAEGRNGYQFYTQGMNERAQDLLLLEGQLRKALEKDELFLAYQPQIELASGTVVGVEALLRWNHPERGLVSPVDFIPLAEETGLIVPMGEWVLRTACRQNIAWQEQGHPPFKVAVNISARQFRQPGFIDLVDSILEETGLDPRWLELEITESVVMDDVDEAILTLTDLKLRGVGLAIDDFGTGYSSLAYLKSFPIDILKIDRAFVSDVTTDSNDAAIATSIMALGRSMNLQIVAEGVETEEQREFLASSGCDYAQGFLFSRPLPEEETARFLAQAELGRISGEEEEGDSSEQLIPA